MIAADVVNKRMETKSRMFWGRLVLFSLLMLLSANLVWAQDEPANGDVIAQAFRTINVRSGPGTNFDVVAQLNTGDSVPVIGRSDDGNNWLLIQVGDQPGWVAFFTVTVIGDPNQLSIIEAASADLPSVTVTAEQNRFAESDYFVSTYRRVNVRSGPGTGFDVIGVLVPGDTADILGSTENDEWLQINLDGEEGWVAYFVVNIVGQPLDVAVTADSLTELAELYPIEVTPSLTPESAPELSEPVDVTALLADAVGAGVVMDSSVASVGVTTRFNTALRAVPELSAELVRAVPFDTFLSVGGQTPDGAWLLVEFDGVEGWLVTSLVDVTLLDLSRVPVVEVSASGQ
jgi:uncharacterized protein YraI